MDNKKRAQAAWAVLLALLALLFIPQVPNLPRNSNPSESPAEDPAPDESGEENSDPNEDGTEDTSPDGSDEGWFQDDPESVGDPDAPTGTPDSGGVAPAPEDGQGWEAPEDYGDGTGTGSGTFGDIIDDLLDDYPSADAAPDWLPPFFEDSEDSGSGDGGETTYGNDPYGNVEDYPTVVPDLREDPQSFEELGADLQNRISGAAAVLSLPAAQLFDELKDPVTDGADETVQWALDNPAQAVLVTGVAVAGGAALLVTASGTTAVSGAAASTLLGTGIITRSSFEAAESRIEDLTGQGDDDTPPATPGSGGHEEIEEPEPDPVSAPSGSQDTIDGTRGVRRGGAVPDLQTPSGSRDTIEGTRGVRRGGAVPDLQTPSGSHEEIEEPEPDPVSAPSDEPDDGDVAPAPEDGQGWEAPEDYGDGTTTDDTTTDDGGGSWDAPTATDGFGSWDDDGSTTDVTDDSDGTRGVRRGGAVPDLQTPSGSHEEIEEPEPDPVSAPSDDPWSPAPEIPLTDPDSGEGGYLPGGFV